MSDVPSPDSSQNIPQNKQPSAQEISGIIKRINQLGFATERMFSRLYTGLTRKNQREERLQRERRRQQLQHKIDMASRVYEQNKSLKTRVKERAVEVDRLSGILSAIDEGIVMQDMEGRIVYMNTAAKEMLGTTKNFWNTQLGMLFESYRDVTHVNTEITPLSDPTRVQVNNRIVGAQMAAVADNEGERLGTMIVLRDVTKDALADRLKDHFVTAISHELKTPMTVIKGMSEVLISSPQDKPPNRRLLETLSRNVDILDRMVVELLDISEMGADTFSIRDDVVQIEPLIWSVVRGITPELKNKELDAAVMARDVNHLFVQGDDQRLRWALGHLLQNSAHYNEPGGNIMVAAALDEDNPEQVIIDVIDSGVGISPKDLPHVFERFYRGEPRTRGGKLLDPRGLGQGLFVARTVAESHGGYVTVRSEIGKGSCFTMVLPTAKI